MKDYWFVGMDVHKKVIAVCIKERDGSLVRRAKIPANREALGQFAASLQHPWIGAMESTLFSAWIYDFLEPHAAQLFMAHPQMLKAITAAKKKNDSSDAEKIADLLRCDLLPQCWTALPQVRAQRQASRFRNLMMRQAARMLSRMRGLMLECGVGYGTRLLTGGKYFARLNDDPRRLDYVRLSVVEMLHRSRAASELFRQTQ